VDLYFLGFSCASAKWVTCCLHNACVGVKGKKLATSQATSQPPSRLEILIHISRGKVLLLWSSLLRRRIPRLCNAASTPRSALGKNWDWAWDFPAQFFLPVCPPLEDIIQRLVVCWIVWSLKRRDQFSSWLQQIYQGRSPMALQWGHWAQTCCAKSKRFAPYVWRKLLFEQCMQHNLCPSIVSQRYLSLDDLADVPRWSYQVLTEVWEWVSTFHCNWLWSTYFAPEAMDEAQSSRKPSPTVA